ncbi:class I SAM-dependent methyltransferase [bacterium]|nr:class I SAM-dependent methyltransferase [bacterium]MDB4489593.1 class I SAM-dependent methyltransferase [bacterium]
MSLTEENFTHLINGILSPKVTGELDYESFSSIKDICKRTKPTSILELGFNRGASALMWLENSKASLHSVDIRTEMQVLKSTTYLTKYYPNRFTYTSYDHSLLPTVKSKYINKYDLIFVDGDHSREAILRDTKIALTFNPKYIAFDDYFHRSHGQDTKDAIQECKLEIISEYNTSCGHVLTKNPFYNNNLKTK